jgi:hypothetical protein
VKVYGLIAASINFHSNTLAAMKLFTSFLTRGGGNGMRRGKPRENLFKALILMRSLTTQHQHSNLKQTGHKKYQFTFSFKTNYLRCVGWCVDWGKEA